MFFSLFFWRECFLAVSPWQQQGQIPCTQDLAETQEILLDLLLHLLFGCFFFSPKSKRAEHSASRESATHEYMNNGILRRRKKQNIKRKRQSTFMALFGPCAVILAFPDSPTGSHDDSNASTVVRITPGVVKEVVKVCAHSVIRFFFFMKRRQVD